TDEQQATELFDALLRLRAHRWAARGTFADPWFEAFHRRLIRTRAPHGEIQLIRVSSGGTTLGCLYNLVLGGRVVFYQCGFASVDDPNLKPGYLSHAAAVEYNALAGHVTYELVGGNPKYKENLATGAHSLLWLRVQPPHAR